LDEPESLILAQSERMTDPKPNAVINGIILIYNY